MRNAVFPILSISGYEGAGKDTLASLLVPHGFAHLHNAWWAKEITAAALRAARDPNIPEGLVEAYVSTDHRLKELPLHFPPFNGRSSRRFQIDTIEAMPMEERFRLNLEGRFLNRTQPLAISGMRMTSALTYWKQQAQVHNLPLKFVWVINPEKPEPEAPYDKEPDMFPDVKSGFWDAVVINERGNPEGMVPQLMAQVPEVDALIYRER